MKPPLILLAAAALTLAPGPSGSARAFDCQSHFAEAWAAISKVVVKRDIADGGLSDQAARLAEAYLRVAKMTLVEAKYHHSQDDARHHARAIVRAKEALGYAAAADGLYREVLGG